MFSSLSRCLRIFIFIFPLSFMLGCGGVWNEDQPEEKKKKVLQIDSKKSCFKKMQPRMQKFFGQGISEKEVRLFWQCLEKGVLDFSKYVEGSDQKMYQQEELISLLEKYVTKAPISQKSLSYVLEIKALFLGGDEKSLSQEEIHRLLYLIKDFTSLSLQIRPYADILFHDKDWDKKDLERQAHFQEGSRQFLLVQRSVAQLLEKGGKSYEISRFPHFLESLQALVRPSKKWKFVSTVKRYLPLVHALKSRVIGQPRDTILSNQWSGFVDLLSIGFVQHLRADVMKGASEDIWSSESKKHLLHIVKDMNRFFRHISEKYGKYYFSVDDLNDVLEKMNVFWPDRASISYVVEPLMTFKALLVGGSKTVLRVDELHRIPQWVDLIYKIYSDLSPYMSIYKLHWQPKAFSQSEQLQLERAITALQISSHKIQAHLFRNKKPYQLSSLVDLINLTQDKPLSRDFYNLIFQYKKIFVGGNHLAIQGKEWQSFIQLTQNFWGNYVRYHYYHKYQKGFSFYFSKYGIDSLQKIFLNLSKNFKHHKFNYISTKQVTDFFVQVSQFVNPKGVDKDFILKIFDMKPLLLGGDRQKITKNELTKAITLLEDLKHYSSVLPRLGSYLSPSFHRQSKVNDRDWNSFLQGSERFLRYFSGTIEKTRSQVSISDLHYFVNKTLKNKADISLSLEQVKHLRFLITGKKGKSFDSSEFAIFLKRASQIYLSYISGLRLGEGKIEFILASLAKPISKILQDDQRVLRSKDLAQVIQPLWAESSAVNRVKSWIISAKSIVLSEQSVFWTTESFAQIPKKIMQWSGLGRRLVQYNDVLSLQGNVTLERFTQFEKDWGEIFNLMGRYIDSSKGTLKISHLSSLLEMLHQLGGVSIPPALLDRNFLHKTTHLFFAGSPTQVSRDQWPRVFEGISSVFTEFARWRLFKKSSEKSFVSHSMDWSGLFNSLAQVARSHPQKSLEWSRVLAFLEKLQEHYPEASLFPKSWSHEIPALKVMFVGGTRQKWRVRDIELTPVVVQRAYQFSRDLQPHIPLLSMETLSWDQGMSQYDKILDIFIKWARTFDTSGGILNLDQFPTMAPHIGEEIFSNSWFKIVAILERYGDLIKDLKKAFIGGEREMIRPGQWERTFHLGTVAYFAIWQWETHMVQQNLMRSPSLNRLREMADMHLEQTQKVLQEKDSKHIDVSELSEVVRSLRQLGFLPEKVSVHVMTKSLSVILKKIIARDESLPLNVVLTPQGVDKILFYMKKWLDSQSFIAFLFEKEDQTHSLAEIRKVWRARLLEWKKQSWQEQPKWGLFNLDINRLKNILNVDFSMAQDSEGLFHFAQKYQLEEINYSYNDLTSLNGFSFLVSFFFDGYVSKDSRKLTQDGFHQVYQDFKELAYAFEAFDPRVDGTWKVLALGADMFTYHSDGDGKISHEEAVSLVTQLLSGSVHTLGIQNNLSSTCALDKVDIYQKSILSFPCLSVSLFSEISNRFRSSLGLRKGLQSLFEQEKETWQWKLSNKRYRREIHNDVDENDSEWDEDEIAKIIAKLDRRQWMKEGEYEFSQLRSFVQITFFVEVLFQRFDSNGDDLLSKDEILRSFPLFDRVLLEVSELEDREKRRSLLTYIMSHRKVPDGFWSEMGFMTWHSWNDQVFHVDRRDMIKTFTELMSALN